MVQKTISAIYCDDIRMEVGGKLSFMGVYNSDMIFPELPAVVPKLCAYVTIRLPYDEPPQHEVHVLLLNGDQILAEVKIDEASLGAMGLPPPDHDVEPEDLSLRMSLNFVISSIQVDAPIRIKLRAKVDGEEIKGDGLRIRTLTVEELSKVDPTAAQ